MLTERAGTSPVRLKQRVIRAEGSSLEMDGGIEREREKGEERNVFFSSGKAT